jgi:hypothetical protein
MSIALSSTTIDTAVQTSIGQTGNNPTFDPAVLGVIFLVFPLLLVTAAVIISQRKKHARRKSEETGQGSILPQNAGTSADAKPAKNRSIVILPWFASKFSRKSKKSTETPKIDIYIDHSPLISSYLNEDQLVALSQPFGTKSGPILKDKSKLSSTTAHDGDSSHCSSSDADMISPDDSNSAN